MDRVLILLLTLVLDAAMADVTLPRPLIVDGPPELKDATDSTLTMMAKFNCSRCNVLWEWKEVVKGEIYEGGWRFGGSVEGTHENEIVLRNLSANTLYGVRASLQSLGSGKMGIVAAVPYDGPDVPVTKARTCNERPGPVSELKMVNKGERKLEVSWLPPYENCSKAVLFFYGKYFELTEFEEISSWTSWGAAPGHENNDRVSSCDWDQKHYCVILEDLDTEKEYAVLVRAQRRTGSFGEALRGHTSLGGLGGGGLAVLTILLILMIVLIIYIVYKVEQRRKRRTRQKMRVTCLLSGPGPEIMAMK